MKAKMTACPKPLGEFWGHWTTPPRPTTSTSPRLGIELVIMVDLFMALLSFVELAPRAYRLKASNAAPAQFNITGTISRRLCCMVTAVVKVRPDAVTVAG